MNGIAALVLVNALAMAVRERPGIWGHEDHRDFQPRHLVALVLGESLLVALGGVLASGWDCCTRRRGSMRSWSRAEKRWGRARSPPRPSGCAWVMGLVGLLAALWPPVRLSRMTTLEGLRLGDNVARSARCCGAQRSAESLGAPRHDAALTLSGLGLVVFVFVSDSHAGAWPGATIGEDRDPANAILLSKGRCPKSKAACRAEIQTGVLASLPESSHPWRDHQVAAVREIALQLTLRKQEGGSLASLRCAALRPMPLPCVPACASSRASVAAGHDGGGIVGTQVAKQFPEARLSETLRFGRRGTVVGIFEAEAAGSIPRSGEMSSR